MKKMFLFAAMASVAFASCTTDESVFDAAKEQGKIEFVAANYVAQTRAEHDDLTFTNADYTVWAWQNGTDVAHMDEVKVTAPSTVTGTYYWPNFALDFAATTPNADPRIALNRASGKSTITFTFDATDVTKRNDHVTNLMFADFVESQSYDSDLGTGNPTVALKFRHVLTRLNVIVQQVNPAAVDGIDSYNVTVNSLSFDDFLNEGSLTIAEDTATNYQSKNYIWAADAATDDWSIITSNTNIETTPFATGYVHGTKNYFVMPQIIPDAAKLNITYTVTTRFDNGTSSVETYTKSVALNTIKDGGANPITKWLTNKNVTYTIKITPADLEPIAFTVNEEEMGTIGGTHQF